MGQTYSNMDDALNGLQGQNDKVRGITNQIGSSIQDYYNQKFKMANRGGTPMPQMNNTTPSISADYFQPQRRGPNDLNFYGGS